MTIQFESHRADALADAVNNDGTTYQRRKEIARMRVATARAGSVFCIVRDKALELRAHHDDIYTAEEIFAACAQVLDYLTDHVEDLDRVAREDKVLAGRKVEFRDGRYVVVRGLPIDSPYPHCYRVVNLETGSESSLYRMAECENIIVRALAGELVGSFDL